MSFSAELTNIALNTIDKRNNAAKELVKKNDENIKSFLTKLATDGRFIVELEAIYNKYLGARTCPSVSKQDVLKELLAWGKENGLTYLRQHDTNVELFCWHPLGEAYLAMVTVYE